MIHLKLKNPRKGLTIFSSPSLKGIVHLVLIKRSSILNLYLFRASLLEKIVNPFLVSKENAYNNFIQTNKFDGFNFFKYLRTLKDNY